MHIDSYQFGEIIIDGKRYTSDVIIYPDRVNGNWWRREGHALCLDDLQEVLKTKPKTIILGTGRAGCVKVLTETEKYLHSQGIKLTTLPTEKAVKNYNQLIAQGEKNIVACLHLTC